MLSEDGRSKRLSSTSGISSASISTMPVSVTLLSTSHKSLPPIFCNAAPPCDPSDSGSGPDRVRGKY